MVYKIKGVSIMQDRSNVLELFVQKKDYFEERVARGIENYRKGDAKIVITNKEGKPIPNVTLKVKQKTHEFRFGANIFMLDEFETPEKNDLYKCYFPEIFNMATLPFYWNALEPERGVLRYEKDSPKIYRRPAPDLCIEFCEKRGIEPREHALAYDGFYPSWLYDSSVEECKKELERRFSEIAERYADKIRTIEVTNELDWLRGRTALYRAPDYLEWCLRLAEKYFPNNQIAINECPGLSWRDKCRTTDKYYSYTEAALLKGARIDAIGMQYHLFYRREAEYEKTRLMLDPENLYKHMDLYARLGKQLQITEITIPAYSNCAYDEEMQAEIAEKVYSVWFSHQNVDQIIYWNLVDGYAHVSSSDPEVIRASQGNMTLGENYYYGGLFRFDMTPKPIYNRLKNLIQKVWHTEAELVSNESGNASFRGFYGKYTIEITGNGHSESKEIFLSKNKENTFNISIDI